MEPSSGEDGNLDQDQMIVTPAQTASMEPSSGEDGNIATVEVFAVDVSVLQWSRPQVRTET